MFKKCRFLSLFICLFLLIANVDVIYSQAADLGKAEAAKIASSIQLTNNARNSMYSTGLSNGNLTFISRFNITNLEQPQHGKLLDSTATVVADNGFSWEIPVLWVNQDGELVKIGIEIDNVIRSYPVFVFYLPGGYSLMFGENTSFNIGMPDFVTNLFSLYGATTLSNPGRGITYISPLLPGQSSLVATTPTGYYGEETTTTETNDVVPEIPSPAVQEPEQKKDDPDTPEEHKYQYQDYNPTIDEETATKIATEISNADAVNYVGKDNVAWFASYIKNVIEPEAVNLLLQKFPAYQAAAESDELGKNLGFYVYYAPDDTLASIDTASGSDGDYSYRLEANAYYSYIYDWSTDGNKPQADYDATSDIYLDMTIVHEMMHAMMEDYTRTGMSGNKYVESSGTVVSDSENAFPLWFVEGIAVSVGSPYQKWVSMFRKYYEYNSETSGYSAETIKDLYIHNEDLRLSYGESSDSAGTDNTKSTYMGGYLANVYLGALASASYDGQSAIIEGSDGSTTINSQYVLNGLNHILEELHNGTSLDSIIQKISTTTTEEGSTTLYSNTEEFTQRFISTTDDSAGDGGASLDFCTKFLNYLESSTNADSTVCANGSVLVDFTSTDKLLLSKELLKTMPEVYVLTDSSEYAQSTIDVHDSYTSAGTHTIGITENSTADETPITGETDGYASVPAKDAVAEEAEESEELKETEEDDKPRLLLAEAIKLGMEEADEAQDGKELTAADTDHEEEAADDSKDDVDAAEDSNGEELSEKTDDTEVKEKTDAPADEPEPESSEEQSVEEPAEEPAAETVTNEAEAPFIPESIILSEADPENSDGGESENAPEEQILDAIPEDNADEEDSSSPAPLTND